MTADNASVIANGAVGMTGLTRATVIISADAASATDIYFSLPKTFILKGFLPGIIKADESGSVTTTIAYVSGDQYKATLSAAAGAGAEIYLFGILGRRDQGPRSTSNPYSENPNTAGRP